MAGAHSAHAGLLQKMLQKTPLNRQGQGRPLGPWHSWVDTGVLGLGGIRTGAVASGPCGCSLNTGPGRGTEAAVLFKIVQNDVDFSVCIQGEQRCDISLKAKDAELV